jgi:hypothetical protein
MLRRLASARLGMKSVHDAVDIAWGGQGRYRQESGILPRRRRYEPASARGECDKIVDHFRYEIPTMSKFLAVLPLVALALLAACGSESDKASAKPAASTAPAPAAAPAAPAAYEATLAEGIQFSREGYPRFVREAKGVSGREDFGRWTDGAEASFAFADPLPTKFTLNIDTVRSYGPNAGKRLRVKAGDWSAEVGLEPGPQTLRFSVTSSTAPQAIQLSIPAPTSPKQAGEGDDPRMLGIALKRMSITTP